MFNSLPSGKFFKVLFIILLTFQNQKFFQEYHLSQTDWIQIRPDVLSGLILVKSICNGYRQTTLGDQE